MYIIRDLSYNFNTFFRFSMSITFSLYKYIFSGVGEQGKPAYLGASETGNYDSLYRVNGFNAALSDKIALDRAVPDIRHKG